MYYIYHIPGVKIGCTLNPKRRVTQQGYSEFEILEEHVDMQTASERERQLQRKYGYEVDTQSKIYSSQFSDMGKKGGGKHSKKQLNWRKIRGKQLSNEFGHLFAAAGTLNFIEAAIRRSKKVIGININTKESKIYKSITEAARDINTNRGYIRNVINGKSKQIKGYKFELYEKN